MTDIDIWSPRYSTNDCLVLASKVKQDSEKYRIRFTKAKHLEGNSYTMTGRQIKDLSHLTKTAKDNKTVYAIPMLTLEMFKEG